MPLSVTDSAALSAEASAIFARLGKAPDSDLPTLLAQYGERLGHLKDRLGDAFTKVEGLDVLARIAKGTGAPIAAPPA